MEPKRLTAEDRQDHLNSLVAECDSAWRVYAIQAHIAALEAELAYERERNANNVAQADMLLRDAQSALCSAHGERLWPGETLAEQIAACIQERTRTIDDLEGELREARESLLAEVKTETGPCRCHEAYTARGLIDPGCCYHEVFPLGEETYRETP